MKMILKTPRGTFTAWREEPSADEVEELKEMVKRFAESASRDTMNYFTMEDAYDEDGVTHSLLVVTREMFNQSVILITG